MAYCEEMRKFPSLSPEALVRWAGGLGMKRSGESASACLLETIRSVKAVGAVVNGDGILSGRDAGILKNTFTLLAQGGFSFAPDLTLDAVNLANRRDYLAEDTQADLHVFCYVYSPRRADVLASAGGDIETLRKMDREALLNAWKYCAGINEVFFHKQSDHHYDGRAWENAAARQGAKIIATYGFNRTEINTGDFAGDTYAEWIGTGERLARRTPLERQGDSCGYGFLVRQDFMTENAPLLARAKERLFKPRAPR